MATPSLGVMFRREHPLADLPSWAKRVEELGFDELWVVEDCFYAGGIAQAAAALASATTLKVGIGINPGVARNAAFLAMEYATLAHLFPGRVIGGIGHGVGEWMAQIGAKPASPLTAITEVTDAVERILRGERVTVDGRYVKLTDVQLETPPSDVPPILLGVRGEKSLEVAGRVAEGALLSENAAPAYVAWAREIVDRSASAAGREASPTISVYAHTAVDEADPARARDMVRRTVSETMAGLGPHIAQLPYANELGALIDRGPDALYAEMDDAWLDDLALGPTLDAARAGIQRLADAGADSVVLMPGAGWDYWPWLESVAPLVRE